MASANVTTVMCSGTWSVAGSRRADTPASLVSEATTTARRSGNSASWGRSRAARSSSTKTTDVPESVSP